MTPRLKERYLEEIKPELVRRFQYKSPMQAPRLEKITLNMGLGEAKVNTSLLDAAAEQLATIAGQKPAVRRARKSIANFKLRQGMPVGMMVTLRGDRMWEMLDRLESIAIPRIRDFRGLNPRSFDGRGNYSLGIREQIIFPEIDYDAIDQVRGLDVAITTSAQTDEEGFELLRMLGMPFRQLDGERSATVAAERAATGNGAGPAAEEAQPQQEEAEPAAAADEADNEADAEDSADEVVATADESDEPSEREPQD
jgi:large subunit ribosomal protein L5